MKAFFSQSKKTEINTPHSKANWVNH